MKEVGSTAQLERAAKARTWIFVQPRAHRSDVAQALSLPRRDSSRRSWLSLPLLLNPCQASRNVRKAVSEPRGSASGQVSPIATRFIESQTPPVRCRLVRCTAKKYTNRGEKLPFQQAICHAAAHQPRIKPLKTKALDDDIKDETPKSGHLTVYICQNLPFSAIL